MKQQQFQLAMQHDKGVDEKWYEPATDLKGWKTINYRSYGNQQRSVTVMVLYGFVKSLKYRQALI
ncbi:MAG: hypothetical protein WDO19_33135 [Bacteroidota bacterium]